MMRSAGYGRAVELLTSVERRVLGCLLEKERTVPDTYPLTLNSLVSACNQTSGRQPVLSLSSHEVSTALVTLRERQLIRRVLPSHGARTEKYRQVVAEVWELEDDERAVLTLLLLRGPQTVGELRSHSGRLHDFADLAAVEAALASLAERPEPMVARLDRELGRKEPRWMHLLTPEDERAAETSLGAAVMQPPAGAAAHVEPHEGVVHLVALFGTWSGNGAGSYPTIEEFGYSQTLSFTPVAGKPLVAYRSATKADDDGRPLHAEAGWLRPVGRDGVELVVAQGSGILEASEGVVEADGPTCALIMASSVLAGTSTAKDVSATEREYRVDGDQLTYRISMAAVGQELQHHLAATLRRDV
jgi:uncharacterized protein YceH (UPF0502 family)